MIKRFVSTVQRFPKRSVGGKTAEEILRSERKADEGKHPAGRVAVAAERMHPRVAMGAFGIAGGRDLGNAGRAQKGGVGLRQIQKMLARTAGGGENGIRQPGRKKLRADLLPDLVARGPDAGTQGGDNVGRVRPEPAGHLTGGFLNDPEARPPPARVNRGHDPKPRVRQEHGETIGRFDGQQQAGDIRRQGIARQASGRRFFNDMNNIRVNLIEKDNPQLLSQGECPEIVLAEIPPPEAVDKARDPGQALVGRKQHGSGFIISDFIDFSSRTGIILDFPETGGGESPVAFVVIDEGEPIESALKRFKRKVQQEAIIKEIKKHSVYYKPGERKRMKEAMARKRMRRRMKRDKDLEY